MRKDKIIYKLLFLFLIFTSATTFSSKVESFFVGSKYSISAVNKQNKLLLVDPINSKGILFDLKQKKVNKTFDYIANYVVHVEPTNDGFLIVDKSENSVFLLTNAGIFRNKVKLERPILTVLGTNNGEVFLILEDLEILKLDSNLKTFEKVSNIGEPNSIVQIMSDIIKNNSSYISDNIAIVENYLVYRKLGIIIDLKTGKALSLAPYISDILHDKESQLYYVVCASDSSIYILSNFETFIVVKVPYRPSMIRKVGDMFCIVSSESDKLLVTKDFNNYQIYDTGIFPKNIFVIQNQCVVYCFESGEIIYFEL